MSITYPSPLPFRLRLLHALTDALKEITPPAGYQFNMGDYDPGDGVSQSRVFRGRPWFGENDPIPMLSVLEGIDPADEATESPEGVATGSFEWSILVQGFVDNDPENPTDPAHLLAADVTKRLAVEVKRRHPTERHIDPFGMNHGRNRLEGITLGRPVCRAADDTSAKAYFWIRVIMHTVEDAHDSYA